MLGIYCENVTRSTSILAWCSPGVDVGVQVRIDVGINLRTVHSGLLCSHLAVDGDKGWEDSPAPEIDHDTRRVQLIRQTALARLVEDQSPLLRAIEKFCEWHRD
jgi:hypothetical protein